MSKKSKKKKQPSAGPTPPKPPTLVQPPARPTAAKTTPPRQVQPKPQPRVESPGPNDKFHNPYNFVPSLPRKDKDAKLGDFPPVGHHQYFDGYWSGRITCNFTTMTPLLIPDAANLTEEKEHKTYPVRMVNGQPYLAPTSIKGMLRSAYEAVTNSRFGIFEEHSDRLAYRMSASKVKLAPARVEYQDNKLVLRLMNGNELMGYAGKLPYYSTSAKDKDKNQCDEKITFPLKYKNSNDKPEHGDKVWVRLNERGNRPKKTIITRIRRRTDGSKPPGEGKWCPGWVCISGENIEGKKYERVFIEKDRKEKPLDVTSEMKEMWRELILDYKKVNKKRPKKEVNKKNLTEPEKIALSRHISEDNSEELKHGTLCYVDLDKNDKVKALLPVILSRRFYDLPPRELLHPSLHPAQKLTELSPSDRVFGWVNQQGTGSYRGQLRINGVQYKECYAGEPIEKFPGGLPLGILGEPRPQQARFYLAKNKQGDPLDEGTPKSAGYQESKKESLRGRKVYPHHPDTLGRGDWKKPMEDRTHRQDSRQEYRRPKDKGIEQKDSQNRSILEWVKCGTVFEFTLDVVNLSPVELGALLWLLDFGKYQKDEENDNEKKDDKKKKKELYHRLGGGKPFGFGSVQIKITKTDLRLGESWRDFYGSLLPVEPPEQEFNDCVEEFKNVVKNVYSKPQFEDVDFIAAFLKCVRGFDDKPIHYPRTTKQPQPQGENFEWFVKNEGTRGFKLALPSLVSDDGLPYCPENPQ